MNATSTSLLEFQRAIRRRNVASSVGVAVAGAAGLWGAVSPGPLFVRICGVGVVLTAVFNGYHLVRNGGCVIHADELEDVSRGHEALIREFRRQVAFRRSLPWRRNIPFLLGAFGFFLADYLYDKNSMVGPVGAVFFTIANVLVIRKNARIADMLEKRAASLEARGRAVRDVSSS